MKLLCIVGTQLRHRYVLGRFLRHFDSAGILFYQRALVQPSRYADAVLDPGDLAFEVKHLQTLKQKEEEAFSDDAVLAVPENIPVREADSRKALNAPEMIDWARSLDADAVFDYGSGILEPPFLKALPEWKINLHGGLSPYYKGSATLLWPFYFQQPQLAGITYHLLEEKIDGGAILQHARPPLYPDDSVTDIACRAITHGAESGIRLLKKLESAGSLEKFPQKNSGKLFLESDYRPSHLKVVYALFEQGLIPNYLSHKALFDAPYRFVDQLGNGNS